MKLDARPVGCAVAALALAAAGCASSAPTTSTITGTIQQQSFAQPVKNVSVQGSRGTTVVPVDTAGRFTVVLERGAKYRLLLSDDGTSTPIALRALDGRLDTTVYVKTGGASVDLGAVSLWSGGGGMTPRILPGAPASAPPTASAEAPISCEDAEYDDQGDGEGDHQCEDGIDPGTGQYCDGGPEANPGGVEPTDASGSDDLGLPQYNLPEQLGCGDDDDHQEGDD